MPTIESAHQSRGSKSRLNFVGESTAHCLWTRGVLVLVGVVVAVVSVCSVVSSEKDVDHMQTRARVLEPVSKA